MKPSLFLCLLLLTSNVYANWSCQYDKNADGSYKDGSMFCSGISVLDSLEQHFCVWYKPNDPYCSVFQAEPPCSDSLEYRTIACTKANTIGVVNQHRNYYCESGGYSAWTTTSENCSPAPATCIEAAEERQIACDPGYEGIITEFRKYDCATPYSVGVWSPWIKTNNSCKKTLVNPTNITSPLSEVSPIKDVVKEQQEQEMAMPILEVNDFSTQESLQRNIQLMPELMPMPKVEVPKVKKVDKVDKIEPVQEMPKEEKKQEVRKPKVPKGKSIVPGFGLTMSLDLLNAPIQMQEIQLNDILNLIQEQDYARQQNFLVDLISQDSIDDAFSSIADARWRSLLYDNPLQSDGFDY